MYAIKVVLQPERGASRTAQQLCDLACERIRREGQPGVEHVSLVPDPPLVMAMTFVMAGSLAEAEQLAAAAWAEWHRRGCLHGWRSTSCTADLALGVWAAQAPFLSDGGAFGAD
ncbi:hypothetical protein ACWCPI_19480 [Streptomyces sp. NPDC001920]